MKFLVPFISTIFQRELLGWYMAFQIFSIHIQIFISIYFHYIKVINHTIDILIYLHFTYCGYLFKSIYFLIILMAAIYLFSSLKSQYIIFEFSTNEYFAFFHFFTYFSIQIILQQMFYYAFLCLAVSISPRNSRSGIAGKDM